MRITVAQLNPTVGDIRGNLAKAKDAIIKAHGEKSDLVVFPELFLVGYPPKDFLEHNGFIRESEKGLERMKAFSAQCRGTAFLMGAPFRGQENEGKGLYNAALFFSEGEMRIAQHKSLLPTYDVFDEARYFDPAAEIHTISYRAEELGISVCEDAWNDPEQWPEGRMYRTDPIDILAGTGASLLINISASPFYIGKEEVRYRLISRHARKHRVPFLYVNQIGGNDELIFDGRSIFVDREGNPVSVFEPFKEQIITIESESKAINLSYTPQEQIESVSEALILGIRDYMRKCGFKKAVVGLSGGIDSAVTICLAAKAVGKENVLGLAMPSPFSSKGSVEDSRLLAMNLEIPFKVISISSIYESYLKTLDSSFKGLNQDITEENIQARIRGNILMAFSNKLGHLVLSTGNKSELAVGYCTLYGDMSGGLAVLSDVPKTMVYKVASFINREKEVIPRSIISKAPSAELKPGQKDEDTLPPYNILDQILNYHIEERLSAGEIVKRGFDPETVRWVIKTAVQNEYKRKQAAVGLKVTSKAFGMGRRMPIAAKFNW